MREVEPQRKKHWAERERSREELHAEAVDAEYGPSEKRSHAKPKEGWNSKRRRLLVLLIAGMVAAFLFLTYSPTGNEWLVRLAGAAAQPAEEVQANPETPAVEEDPQPADEEPQPADEEPQPAASESSATEEEPVNVYAATMAPEVKDSLADLPERVYVPNVIDGTITVIDPKTFKITDSYPVGQLPFHVTPSWDMTKLYAGNEQSSTLTVIDPQTGRPSGTVDAAFPYNLYYTPDGSKTIVVAERLQRIGIRDTKTWELLGSVYIPSPGVDHLDFSADGSYLLASSEYSGVVSKVDMNKMELVGHAEVTGALPVDIKLSPDGKVFYVANQGSGGVSVIDPDSMKEIGFIPTGEGAHGLQISKDTKSIYVSNRLEGTISVIDLATRKVTDTWVTGGTPDMFQLSTDGRQLWVSGRYDGAVYVLDTETGKLLTTIYTGNQPHGISYFPNSGRYSLGHNGVYR